MRRGGGRSSITALFALADRIETMTSLLGFEALIRGIPVTVHGRPFYAGWGLTEDLSPLPRRQRRLSIEELLAGALMLYPVYVHGESGLVCPVEVAVQGLVVQQASSLVLVAAHLQNPGGSFRAFSPPMAKYLIARPSLIGYCLWGFTASTLKSRGYSGIAGMSLRVALSLAVVTGLLAGCATLPAEGPSALAVRNSGDAANGAGYVLIPVNADVAEYLSQQPEPFFGDRFGKGKPSPADRLGPAMSCWSGCGRLIRPVFLARQAWSTGDRCRSR